MAAAAADDQVRDEPGPPGLMRGAESGAGVAVEVFVEVVMAEAAARGG